MTNYRVQIHPAWQGVGGVIDGVRTDEGDIGICIRTDNDETRFYPWTSIAYLVRDYDPDKEQPF